MKAYIFGILTAMFIGSLVANVVMYKTFDPVTTIGYNKEQQRMMDSLISSIDE